MGWMDVTVMVILILSGIKGWIRGFILSLLDVASFFIAWVVAKTYYRLLSAYMIDHSEILISIQGFISKKLEKEAYAGASTKSPFNLLELLKLPKSLEELVSNSQFIEDLGTYGLDRIYHMVAEALARVLIDLLSLLILFFIVKFLLLCIGQLLNGIASIPVLREFNRLGGVLFGAVKGVLTVFILLTILTVFTAIAEGGVLKEGLENSVMAQFLYHHNPIVSLLKGELSVEKAFTIDRINKFL